MDYLAQFTLGSVTE